MDHAAYRKPAGTDDSDLKDVGIHWQNKFGYQNVLTGIDDIINLRTEEILLTQSKCKCRAEDYDEALSLLQVLYESRAIYLVWPTLQMSASIRTCSLRRSLIKSCSNAASNGPHARFKVPESQIHAVGNAAKGLFDGAQ